MNEVTQAKPWFKDWGQYFCPGPTRKFTPEEMARAGTQAWPKGVDQYIVISSGIFSLIGIVANWRFSAWVLGALAILGYTAMALWASRQIWRQPTRLRLNISAQLGALLMLAVILGVDQWAGLSRTDRQSVALTCILLFGMASAAGWFLSIYRVEQIESRLRDLDAREAEQRLQRRLATAQIHPHFVFNTLASLTHWVETQDPRAAPMLRDFSAYLRATLPMFERERQSLREELDLVRRYLAIMAARLGERLQWSIDADPELENLELPPGSLLTLVENAITHGIEPALRGGKVQVSVQRVEQGARLVVSDTGRGIAGPPTEGLGLSNTRQRLMTLHPSATMTLESNAEGGCSATLSLPLQGTAEGAVTP